VHTTPTKVLLTTTLRPLGAQRSGALALGVHLLGQSGGYRSRSYWIPGSYAPALSKKRNAFLRLLKNKGFRGERRTKVGVYAIGKSTTLECNKSLRVMSTPPRRALPLRHRSYGLMRQ